jgi:hypothetical protein
MPRCYLKIARILFIQFTNLEECFAGVSFIMQPTGRKITQILAKQVKETTNRMFYSTAFI